MLNKEKYEEFKQNLVVSERLFKKLHKVSLEAENIDYDESGLYDEDEQRCKRHWLKLSSKIIDNISDSMMEYNIELLTNKNLEDKHLIMNLIFEGQESKIKIDYSNQETITITQVS